MPLYEYECEACGHRFEKIVKFSDPPLDVCPVCGGKVRKLISSPAFQFKGSGFYITDYAKKETVGAGKTDRESREEGGSDKSSKDTKDSKDGKDAKDSKDTTSAKASKGSSDTSSKSESKSGSSASSDASGGTAKPSKD